MKTTSLDYILLFLSKVLISNEVEGRLVYFIFIFVRRYYFRIIRRLVVYHVRITLVQPPLPFQSTHTSSIPRLLGAGPRPMRCSNLLRRFPEGFFSQTYDATVRLLLLSGRSFASSIANKRWESNKAAGNHSLIQLQPIDHGVNRRTVRMPT